ncbi:MAG: flagellar basal body-associated FliL family protein [Desulfobacterales bacterium]|jgi:flagellar FliL protein|nr:flagellar basal body-associated FliL family protein [Desulfobacterales bacterium]
MSNKLPVILLGVLLLLMLGMGGGLFMIWSKVAAIDALAAREGGGAPEAGKGKPEEVKPVVSLETFIVNLADPGGGRYLRVTMDLETAGKPAADEIGKRVPQLRDAVLMILPTKRFADINTLEGKTALREEIIGAINGMLGTAAVSRIFFKEFVIQ